MYSCTHIFDFNPKTKIQTTMSVIKSNIPISNFKSKEKSYHIIL